MKNILLVLIPQEFQSYSKFERKLLKICSNFDEYSIIYNSDSSSELLKKFKNSDSKCTDLNYVENYQLAQFTHAIIFKDDQIFSEETNYVKSLKIPLRVIQIKITRVINIDIETKYKKIKKNDNYEYIGRGSNWGNPYSMTTHSLEDRNHVINLFKYDFDKDNLLKAKKAEVYTLAGKRLGCYCKPFPCHGDIIANFLNEWDDGE